MAKNEENIVEENSEYDEEHNDENDEENEEENDENLWPNEAPKLRSFEAFGIVIEIFSFGFENSTLFLIPKFVQLYNQDRFFNHL